MAPSTGVPQVEFLWWNDCPSWDRALSELREQMDDLGLDPAAVSLLQIESADEAREHDFIGSPTIRIDGTDIEDPGNAEPQGPALTCRVYRLADGRISALPDPALVRAALEVSVAAADRAGADNRGRGATA